MLRPLHADAVVGEVVAGVLEVLARLQQRLARDAADVGAGAARRRAALGVLPLVDAGGVEAELRGADGGDVAAGAAADDDDVEVLGHGFISSSVRTRISDARPVRQRSVRRPRRALTAPRGSAAGASGVGHSSGTKIHSRM